MKSYGGLTMRALKIIKIFVALDIVALILLLCLSGPFHKPDSSVSPLLGTVKVQLSGGKYPVDIESLTTVLQAGETENLYLFKNLTEADFSGSTCYDELAAWAEANPQVNVKYTVAMPDGTVYDNSTTTVDLSNIQTGSAQNWAETLKYLPKLSLISLGTVDGESISLEELAMLRNEFPNVEFSFSLDLLGQEVLPDQEYVDLSSMKATQLEEALPVLACLTELKEIRLSSSLSWDDVNSLAETCPNTTFDYEFTMFDRQLNLNAESLDLNHITMDDEGAAVKELLPLMRNCTYLDMDYCGVSNEAMAKIRDENPDIEVVWRIWFGENYSVRTDAEKILASKPSVGGMVEDTSMLKYCTKMKYVDLGHNDDLSDISFVSYMPDLEVLIVAMDNVSDLSPLADCPKLEYLEIQTNPITDISPLANCTELAHLNICQLPDLKDISPILGLTKLERVWIGANTPIPEKQVEKLKAALPDCTVDTTASEPHANAWRFSAYDPEEPKYWWVPRYELLRAQLGYDYQEYSFYWLDPKCGDPAPAEYAGMFGKEVYG
jgi:hypothetical protein